MLLFQELTSNNTLLPYEIQVSLKMLFSSIKKQQVLLPMVSYEIERINIESFSEVLQSIEYRDYSDCYDAISQSPAFQSRHLDSLEKAGKSFVKKNHAIFRLRENIIDILPFTNKVVDVFLGKLPAILTEYTNKLLSDFLKKSNNITIYNCKMLNDEISAVRYKQFKIDQTNQKYWAKLLDNTTKL